MIPCLDPVQIVPSKPREAYFVLYDLNISFTVFSSTGSLLPMDKPLFAMWPLDSMGAAGA